MKPSFIVAASICLAMVVSLPAAAGTLYENGPINGQTDAWTINFGYAMSDSITISTGQSTITGLSFGVWLSVGDSLQSADVSFTSDPYGGTTYFDQVVNFTASGCFVNNYGYDVCKETGSFSGFNLNNGTYWLNIQNAVSTQGDPVYWDENSGIGCHSPGCPSEATGGGAGTLPSEAFSVLGTAGSGTTPEPGSLMLFVSGVAGAAAILRRKLR